MASQPSSSGGGDSGAVFTQTGTVDWGQLGSRTVAFSVDVLSRVSAAKVDPYTLEVGRVISSQFELSRSGTTNMNKALSNLRCNGSLGTALWFGFGVRHLVRVLPSTDEGLTCLALCSTMSEYYPHDICAEIFHEILKAFDVPPHGTPSIMQWEALIGACAGSLARSDFGPLVDRMIDLSPFQWSGMLNQTGDADHDDLVVVHRGWCTPKSIAAALIGVGSVSRGETKAITVMGGNDAGWFAAVCLWLFDVRIIICTTTGDELFSNCGKGAPQVKIIYEQWQSSQPRGASSRQTDSRELICIGKTFVLAAVTDVIKRRSVVSRPLISGRSSWEHILSATFGHEFEELMKNHHLALANAIGSAARLFQGIVNSEEEIPKDLVDEWDLYVADRSEEGLFKACWSGSQSWIHYGSTHGKQPRSL
jgi:hypothetical protein